MNSKITTGKDQQLTGSVKEALGKLTGIDELEKDGAHEKGEGEAEEAIGRKQASAAKKSKKTKSG